MPISQNGFFWLEDTLTGLESLGSDDALTPDVVAWAVNQNNWYYPSTINPGTSTWDPLVAPSSGWTNVYDVNFSALANQTINSGTNVIDGNTWTTLNFASSSTFEISLGQGLRIVDDVLGIWSGATQGGPAITVPVSTIDPGGRADDEYRIRFYFSWTPVGAGSTTVLGVYSTAGVGANNAYLAFATSNQVISRVNAQDSLTSVTTTDVSLYASNVAMVDVKSGASYVIFYAGTYAGGWPQMDSVFRKGGGGWARGGNLFSTGGIYLNEFQILIGISGVAAIGNEIVVHRMSVDRYRR